MHRLGRGGGVKIKKDAFWPFVSQSGWSDDASTSEPAIGFPNDKLQHLTWCRRFVPLHFAPSLRKIFSADLFPSLNMKNAQNGNSR